MLNRQCRRDLHGSCSSGEARAGPQSAGLGSEVNKGRVRDIVVHDLPSSAGSTSKRRRKARFAFLTPLVHDCSRNQATCFRGIVGTRPGWLPRSLPIGARALTAAAGGTEMTGAAFASECLNGPGRARRDRPLQEVPGPPHAQERREQALIAAAAPRGNLTAVSYYYACRPTWARVRGSVQSTATLQLARPDRPR